MHVMYFYDTLPVLKVCCKVFFSRPPQHNEMNAKRTIWHKRYMSASNKFAYEKLLVYLEQ